MESDHLTSLLAEGGSEPRRRSPDCPDEGWIAGYVDGGLDGAGRQKLERHLADCGHCLALVGLLSRERHAPPAEPVPSLVLSVPLLAHLSRSPDAGFDGQGRPAPAAVRRFDSRPGGLQVLVPDAGGAVDAQRVRFRWTAVAGSPYYDVRVVTDEGDVVVRRRVTGTAWELSAEVQLRPGAEYFVHVDAYPSGDKAVSSDHVPFRVSD